MAAPFVPPQGSRVLPFLQPYPCLPSRPYFPISSRTRTFPVAIVHRQGRPGQEVRAEVVQEVEVVYKVSAEGTGRDVTAALCLVTGKKYRVVSSPS